MLVESLFDDYQNSYNNYADACEEYEEALDETPYDDELCDSLKENKAEAFEEFKDVVEQLINALQCEVNIGVD